MRIMTALLLAAAVLGQSLSPSFEAASIHPSLAPAEFTRQHGQPPHFILTPARVDLQVASVSALIEKAYQLESFQLSGPDWMNGTRFDIQAKPSAGATQDQILLMLQNLLAGRFQLAVHHEQRELNVYALVVAKDGPKIREASSDAEPPPASPGHIPTLRMLGDDGKPIATNFLVNGRGVFEAAQVTMSSLASFLRNYLDDPVVDRTGLTGVYQFSLDVPAAGNNRARIQAARGPVDGATPADAATEPTGSSIISTIQSLGLRLEHRKEHMDVLVVDHLEKTPTEN
jgi:uncharacterized protein (TIGR03435 family)